MAGEITLKAMVEQGLDYAGRERREVRLTLPIMPGANAPEQAFVTLEAGATMDELIDQLRESFMSVPIFRVRHQSESKDLDPDVEEFIKAADGFDGSDDVEKEDSYW